MTSAERSGPATVPFVALVPARLASTRLPGKALADLGGQPMVVRVARRAKAAGAARVAVATDDERIATAVRAAGFEVVMTAASHPSGTDRLAEAVARMGLAAQTIVVNVQGDEPLVPPGLIAGLAADLAQDPDAAIATAGHPITELADLMNPNMVKIVCDRHRHALYFSRAPIPFDRERMGGAGSRASHPPDPVHHALRHIGLYAYRVSFLAAYPGLARSPLETLESLEQLRALWHGFRIVVRITDEAPPAGIDTAEDLARVRAAWPQDPDTN